jgi:hypothetical protein
MRTFDRTTTAAVSIDMHRGHLDPEVATMPLPAENCRRVIGAADRFFGALRSRGVLPETAHYVANVQALRSRFGG